MQPPVLRACCRTSSRCVPVSTMRSVGVSPSEPAAQRSRGRRCCACCCASADAVLGATAGPAAVRKPAARSSRLRGGLGTRAGDAKSFSGRLPLGAAACLSASDPHLALPTFAAQCKLEEACGARLPAGAYQSEPGPQSSQLAATSSARACERSPGRRRARSRSFKARRRRTGLLDGRSSAAGVFPDGRRYQRPKAVAADAPPCTLVPHFEKRCPRRTRRTRNCVLLSM